MHPSKKILKTYQVKVKGIPEEKDLDKLRRGIKLEDGLTAPAKVKKIKATENNAWIGITIHEGRNRQVRRMFEKIGHTVIKLIRIKINGISLGNMKPGEYRFLEPEEINKLKSEVK